MVRLLPKAALIWLLIVIMAIVNAAIREKLLAPIISSRIALPVSGMLLSVFVFLIAFLSIPFFSSTEGKSYIFIGVAWLVLTLLFEFLFGHFFVGKPWHEILQVFNIRKGDLFIVALLVTLIAPWLSAKLRGLI
jgi:hypothetical protein